MELLLEGNNRSINIQTFYYCVFFKDPVNLTGFGRNSFVLTIGSSSVKEKKYGRSNLSRNIVVP